MQVVILAGGMKSVLSEYEERIPKPMLEIGGRPILWHIMKYYSSFGINDFIVCGGYKINEIKEYFKDFYIYQSDITVDLKTNEIKIHRKRTEDWRVTIIDTGLETGIVQRINQIKSLLGNEFIVTYGDCLYDIDIPDLRKCFRESDKIAMLAVANPTGRNQVIQIEENNMLEWDKKKGRKPEAWVNACVMIFKKEVFQYFDEKETLETILFTVLAKVREMKVYKHYGFWSPVETMRDKTKMEYLVAQESAPWVRWNE